MDFDAGPEGATFDEAMGRRISRAVKDWTGQLVDVTGRNTLLCFRDLKAGTLDLSGATDVAVERLLAGHAIRFDASPRFVFVVFFVFFRSAVPNCQRGGPPRRAPKGPAQRLARVGSVSGGISPEPRWISLALRT
jgi:hypothetical protein